uniref:Uncharacterized protein n=1 Tax=Romanomermis culicivorax TaxID=13658 RepID=A0A915KQK5_ROMCU
MLADQNSTKTSSLLQKYNGCVQTYVEVVKGTQFSATVANFSQTERSTWAKILLDDQFP